MSNWELSNSLFVNSAGYVNNNWFSVTYGNGLFVAVSGIGDSSPPIYSRTIPMYASLSFTVIDVSSNITSTYGNVPFIYNYSSNNPSIPTYSSSNTSVATINSSGLVTILSGGTTTLTINQSSTENYTDGSANSILTVQPDSNFNPVVITNGNGIEYFLTTNSIYAILIENININENLVNQGNATKIISSNSFNKIYK